ncbi:MAG: hypothetical protein ACTSUN_02160 [Promethearchaeota archaeon]
MKNILYLKYKSIIMEGKILYGFYSKLYSKETFSKWDLPEGIKEQLEFDVHDYFFISTSREHNKGKNHGQTHLHMNIYPINQDTVYLLEVRTKKVEPELLYEVLKILKRENYRIITSSGFCMQDEICFFGVWFGSESIDIDAGKLLKDIKEFEKAEEANLAKFTCEGCFKISP